MAVSEAVADHPADLAVEADSVASAEAEVSALVEVAPAEGGDLNEQIIIVNFL